MSLSGLPGEARERVRKDVRATLQFHRDLARGTVCGQTAKKIDVELLPEVFGKAQTKNQTGPAQLRMAGETGPPLEGCP